MIRRSFNIRFRDAILNGVKTTTIREKPWPIGVPIMAFHWSGLPYRSKQVNIAPVIVTAATSIDILLGKFSGKMIFSEIMGFERPLWECEGFKDQADMDAWFKAKLKPGQTVTQTLMRFRVAHELITTSPISA